MEKSNDTLKFSFNPIQSHNKEEKSRVMTAALYTAIEDAKKMHVNKIAMNNADFELAKNVFTEIPVEKTKAETTVSKQFFNNALKNIEQALKSNYDELENIFKTESKFKPEITPLTDLKTKPVTIGINGNLKTSLKDPDIQVKISMDKEKIFLTNTGKSQRDSVKILGSKSVNQGMQVELHHGDTIKLGSEIFILNHNKDKDQYELRLLVKNDKGDFEKLFPDGTHNINFQQGGIGDCYFLSATKALSRSVLGAELLAKIIEPKGNNRYKVTFPGFPKESFEFSMSEINDSPTIRFGDLGMKVLEHGLFKLKEKLQWPYLPSGPLPQDGDKRKWLEGGLSEEAMNILSNSKMIRFETPEFTPKKGYTKTFATRAKEDPKIIEDARALLKQLNEKGDSVAICAETSINTSETYFIAQDHAYAVSKINPDKEEITLVNPWFTHKPEILTYKEFFNNYASIKYIELDKTNPIE